MGEVLMILDGGLQAQGAAVQSVNVQAAAIGAVTAFVLALALWLPAYAWSYWGSWLHLRAAYRILLMAVIAAAYGGLLAGLARAGGWTAGGHTVLPAVLASAVGFLALRTSSGDSKAVTPTRAKRKTQDDAPDLSQVRNIVERLLARVHDALDHNALIEVEAWVNQLSAENVRRYVSVIYVKDNNGTANSVATPAQKALGQALLKRIDASMATTSEGQMELDGLRDRVQNWVVRNHVGRRRMTTLLPSTSTPPAPPPAGQPA